MVELHKENVKVFIEKTNDLCDTLFVISPKNKNLSRIELWVNNPNNKYLAAEILCNKFNETIKELEDKGVY